MTSWFSVNLGDALLSQSMLDDLQYRLSTLYERASRPENMTALYRHESKGVHCHLIVYLTEEFQDIATLDNAVRCNAPSPSDISCLAGNCKFETMIASN